MKQEHVIGALALALGLIAAPASAATMDAKTFVAKAGASDLFEREASELVLKSTTDANVKSFAQEMVKDHTASTEKVKAAAMKAHLRPAPPRLEPTQSDMISRLQKAEGASRDHLYVTQQKQAHQQALMLMKDYAAHGDSAPLKTVAAQIVPVVQHHVDMLEHGHM